MLFLLLSFVAGVLTALAPCVLPLLPVIVGGSLAGGSRRRAYTITASLAVSIVLFTLILKASTALIGIPEAFWRYLSGGIIVLFGVFMLFPSVWARMPGVNAMSRGSNKLLSAGYQRGGFWGDCIMGAALGPVFASCSPTYFIILATVLPAQPLLGLIYLAVYALGLSAMLLLIALLGEGLVRRLGVTVEPSGWFRRSLGALLLIVGLLVFTGIMRDVETWLVEKGFDVTRLELKFLGAESSVASEKPSGPDDAFMSPDAKTALYERAPELVSPHGYINTDGKPVTLAELRGKVVLLDIWTYSCINCQRTLPYLKAWYETYEKEGLVIIGVHTPEFAFEREYANVAKAVDEFGLRYPVVLDNDYATWNAYGNHFWPRKYLIDIDGYIVYDHAGEGAYDETESAIRRALAEKAAREGTALAAMPIATPRDVVEVMRGGVQSPEVYFGAFRNESLGNGPAGNPGIIAFELPKTFLKNALYLGGVWDIAEEYARSAGAGSVVFRYEAKNVYMVGSALRPVRVEVLLDGRMVRTVEVSAHRLYTLVEGSEYGEHTLELRIEGAGFDIYTFTFG